MTSLSTSTRVHHNTVKAAARLDAAIARNVYLHSLLNSFDAVCVRSSSTRFNKYTLYFYMIEDRPSAGKRNSPARAFDTAKIWGLYKGVSFNSQTSLLEQENSAIESILHTYFNCKF